MDWQRVVITGLGVLAPNGCGKEAFWRACLQGRSGVRGITRFDASQLPTRIAGEIVDFSPTLSGLTLLECQSLDRGTQFAVAAANLAMQDAGLDAPALSAQERERMGVYIGTAMASAEKGEDLYLQFSGSGAVAPRTVFEPRELTTLLLSNVPSASVAAHHDLHGPGLTISTGCSSGADAIGQAFWLIQQGQAERMLAGGSDSALNQFGISTFSVIHALSTRNEEPERASRPYDVQRDGFVLSEGAAVVLLEERELALARGAHIYAEIVSFTSNGNAYHMTALPPDGAPLQALLRLALAEADLSPLQLGYINAHGSSTRSNDNAETAAYKGVFGSQAYQIPISSTKSLIGHTQGAASAIETVVTALALDQQVLPPTINLETPDPLCDLDYISEGARFLDSEQPLRFALTHSSGFGGVNTALVLARHEPSGLEYPERQPSATRRDALPVVLSRATSASRRVVITGLGAVAPGGIGKAAFWQTTLSGHLAIVPLNSTDAMDAPFRAGQVRNFRVEDYVERKLVQHTDRMTHFVFAAVQEALYDAGLRLDEENPQRIGAVIANTLGGVAYAMQQIEQFYKRGPRAVSAYTAIAWLHVANVGQISVLHGLQGYCKTPVNDLVGGLDALGLAYQAIQRGAADILITGGSEAPLHPYIQRILDSSLTLSPDTYRPFDLHANGLLLAEGAGICILEEYEHARQRGATMYGELVGYAQTCAPRNLANPGPPAQAAYVRALQSVLLESRLTPEDLACVYLDGRALPAWDAGESRALREVFGNTYASLACSVPRTQTGHSLAAAGALDTISALLGLQGRVIAPTLRGDEPDPASCPPGLVRGEARVQQVHTHGALICGRSFGGSHVALAVQNV
jgi:3-oxoacyl-(acyl-carrier-protein) synthase